MKIEYALEKSQKDNTLLEQYHWDRISNAFIGGSVGDGVNKFDIPAMYKYYIKKELDYYGQFTMYGEAEGSKLLVDTVKLYERLIAGADGDNFCKYLSITCGATAAIFFLFSYLKEKYGNCKVKMLGLQYFIFEENCKYNSLEYEYIVSNSKNRILPTIDEIYITLADTYRNIIVLTIPGNPSGEIYSYQEVVEICRLCVKSNSLLIIDKCQLEILTDAFTFINIGRAVLEANAENRVIFVDSLSKLRSLPGVRLGYIYSNDYELAQYIKCYSTLVYACPIRGIESAIVMDMLTRVIYNHGSNDRKIKNKFRNMIIMHNGYEAYQRIYGKAFIDGVLFDNIVTQFISEIQRNVSIVISNYRKAKALLVEDDEGKITDLQGGFNFCIRISDPKRIGERDLIARMTNLVNAKVLSQSFFGSEVQSAREEGYWIRLSAAMQAEEFELILGKIKKGLELLE